MPNKKILVLYKSKYGSTKQYATWIAEELGTELRSRDQIRPDELLDYDLIIYGGSLFIGDISGAGILREHPHRDVIGFTVGLSDPTTTDYTDVINRAIPTDKRRQIPMFHFRGAIDYAKLGFIDKTVLLMLKNFVLGRKKDSALTAEDQAILDTFGNVVDFTDKAAIEPLVTYVKENYFD
ncbi:flavodoxin [Periweissella cryptocerci]|uniref:Flavodoxin n=1 Tax=Periweissella cryptocerci TaxID=2506420 RepID=A0A4P6YVK7_9LACO|nr:flavodoxin domain-containing protein [Periweissella cryptocerci]QBO36842.1 flavodoxin [Periweissella cryptocerci]